MDKLFVPPNKVAKGINDVIGLSAYERVKGEIKVVNLPTKLNILYKLPHIYKNE